MQVTYTKPKVGEYVEVTVSWADIFANFSSNVKARNSIDVSVGRVVPSEKYDHPWSFRMTTGKAHFPVCVVPLDRVIDLRYVDGAELSKKSVQPTNDVKTWTVAGSKGNEYVVTKNQNAWSCTCPGFQFRRQCKHVHEKQSEC